MNLRRIACLLCLLFTTTAVADDKDKAVAAEKALLKGTWRLIHEIVDGEPVPPASIENLTINVSDSSIAVKFGDKVLNDKLPYEIDPTQTPKHVTETVLDGPDQGKKVNAIYKLDGDYLLSSTPKPGADRPKGLGSPKGSGIAFRVYRRDRAASLDKGQAEEIKKFEGTWGFDTLSIGPNKLPAAALKGSKLILKGDRFESVEPVGSLHGVFVLNTETKPKQADLIFVDGPRPGMIQRAIYSLEGDVYTVCLKLNSPVRPTELAPKPEPLHAFEILKREKK